MSDTAGGWPATTLGAVAESVRNGLFARRPNDDGQGTAILRISAVRKGRVDLSAPRFVEDVEAEQVAKFAVQSGDILMTRYNGSRHLVGISGLVPPHDGAILHPDKLIRVVPDPGIIDGRFLNLQLQSPAVRDFLAPRIRTTAGQSGIAGKDVREIPLVLPLLDEQQRIVEILEDYLSRLDAGVNYLDAATRRADRFRAAEAVRALECAGGMPTTLGDAALSVANGIFVSRAGSEPDGVPILRIGSVRPMALNTEDFGYSRLSGDEIAKRGADLQPGDVLFTRYSGNPEYVGAAALVPDGIGVMTYPDKLIRVRVDRSRLRPGYLALSCTFGPGRDEIRSRRKTSAGQVGISGRELKSIALPIPSVDVQDDVLARFENVEAARSGVVASSASGIMLAANLRRALLSAAFSGRLTGASSDLDRVEELAEVMA